MIRHGMNSCGLLPSWARTQRQPYQDLHIWTLFHITCSRLAAAWPVLAAHSNHFVGLVGQHFKLLRGSHRITYY